MWSNIYTAISEHYSDLERAGTITDEELEIRMLQLQRMGLDELSSLFVVLFDKSALTLED